MNVVHPCFVVFLIAVCHHMNLVNTMEWRAIVKSGYPCPNTQTAIKYKEYELSRIGKYKSKLSLVAEVPENYEITAVECSVLKTGSTGKTVKLMGWNYTDICTQMKLSNRFLDPMFASGELPRDCRINKGTMKATNITYDIGDNDLGEVPIGEFIGVLKVYQGSTLLLCGQAGFELVRPVPSPTVPGLPKMFRHSIST